MRYWIDLKRLNAIALGLTISVMGVVSTQAMAQEQIRVSGTGSGTGGMQLLLAAFLRDNPALRGEVLPALGSAGGIRAMIDGKIDLAVANRVPNDKERAMAPLQSVAYARTALAIAVHKDLGITALSSDQLAALYGEGAPNFPNGRRARPVLRLSDATDTQIVRSISPAVAAAIDAASGRRGMLDGATDSDTADLLERTPGAFGPSSLAVIESERRPLIALTINGVTPSLATLANGQWKLRKPLFMIYSDKALPHVLRFVEFVQSAEGRRIMASAGHGEP